MNHHRTFLPALAILACCLPASAATKPWSLSVKTQTLQLSFASDGKPASLQRLADGKELLTLAAPGEGFFLRAGEGPAIPLTRLSRPAPGKLAAASDNRTQEVLFDVKEAGPYLAFRIERLKGIPASGPLTLHFAMNAAPAARVMELDYMTTVRMGGGVLAVDWNFLWNRNAADPLGGFALYVVDDGDSLAAQDAEDETILRIWVDEQLPHPKVSGPWTLAAARKHVALWRKLYDDQSQFYIEATNPADLYGATKYAEAAGCRAVYLFTNTWREGGVFWPDTGGNWEVRRGVFPKGEADFRAYSDYLAARGMQVHVHWVSGGIGFGDPKYVTPKPDRRLAGWGGGRLVKDLGPKAATLLFRPDGGVELPFKIPPAGGAAERLPALPHYFGFHYLRAGDELIRVGAFEDTDRDVWRLTGCQRGFCRTTPAAHPAGEPVAGLLAAYDQNFVPAVDSAILDEMAQGFAGLVNRCRIGNTLYDGLEIHGYNGRWGVEKFAAKVYAALDHPVIANSSSGRPPNCYIEHKLHSVRRLVRGNNTATNGGYSAPVMLDCPSRPASSLLDAHFCMMKAVANDSRQMSVTRPEPMFGLTLAALKGHGLSDRIMEAVRTWRAVDRAITPRQRASLLAGLVPPARPVPDASYDPESALVWEARAEKDRCLLTPVRVLARREGDIRYHSWQEHGPISPKQFLRPGQEIELENPHAAQPPRFILRVLWGFDPAAAGNIPLLPKVSDIQNTGDTAFTADGPDALTLSMDNPREQARWGLTSLPHWPRRIDMTGHRGIGAFVTGDGSKAVLLVQIPGRDYAIPLDFTGRRYVEIPNGEVSWADGRWGWRVETHQADYAGVSQVRLGLGLIPAKTRCTITVESLQALREIPSELVDPVIHVGGGRLRVKGSVRSGEYLQYDGGPQAVVCDANWNPLRTLPVQADRYRMPTGYSKVRITAAGPTPAPWLAGQFLTEGEPMIVPAKR